MNQYDSDFNLDCNLNKTQNERSHNGQNQFQ